MSDPVSIDDPEKDKNTLRDNLMDELCKRHQNFEKNGGDLRWIFMDVWQSGFSGFTDREIVEEVIEEYRDDSKYFDIDDNDMMGLTERGIKYCKERQ
ncbi:MAG: hypothetical protein WCE33_08055 [Nitrososphaeraceae archaeon]